MIIVPKIQSSTGESKIRAINQGRSPGMALADRETLKCFAAKTVHGYENDISVGFRL